MKNRTASGAVSEFFRSQPSFALRATEGFSSPFILAASREVFWRRRIKLVSNSGILTN